MGSTAAKSGESLDLEGVGQRVSKSVKEEALG